ncbi:hypothetical protein Ddye_031353 [Dipteronia dyeriana]|uniref:Cation/H(+) antiporter C-terminal domain-containing protein n=1 Tax=Dipteronia dyeriana TaxID=168575 RepID=A0AAD9TIT1_9ROSI|nr:hypothetical protein Ddye_031353 [Dipteronia dyeriana]
MCCFHYEENVYGIISLLKSCNSIGISPMCVYTVHVIGLVGQAVPLLHPYSSQRTRFKENSTDQIMKALKTSLIKGGPDDCEALVLDSHISGHPRVSITVLWIDLREENFENQSKKYLDDCLVREFKARNIGNASVVCRSLVAENTMQVVDLIRSLENNYDLMIVGKQRGPSSQLEQEMLPWVENEELGTVGDMVASSDFCGGMVSVLVMHCAVGVI